MRRWMILGCAACVLIYVAADKPQTASRKRLQSLQDYVGAWRGVGQVRRGSNKGAWIERGNWAWDFSRPAEPALLWKSAKGKHLRQARLMVAREAGSFRLVGKSPSGAELHYTGKVNDRQQLVLTADKRPQEGPARISLRLTAKGARLIVLYERQLTGKRFTRLAEVGFTRAGSNFGKGTSFVECIVTGGKGTMPVSYQGKTYYVCCSGCRDYFNEDPAKAIAEYKARKAEQKKKKSATSDS